MQKVTVPQALQETALKLSSLKKLSFLIATVFIFLASCSKELKAPEAAPLDPGVLSASANDVVINSGNPGDVAVTFNWTATSNSLIRYYLILSAGSASDTLTIAQNAVSKSFTNGELNTILVSKLGLAIGVVADLNVMAKADVTINDKEATTNVVTIKVTPAATGPAYSKLWVVGDATPNGWNIDNPNEMKVDPTNAFQFKYNEVLNPGEFKIPVSTGNWGTDYFMPPSNNPALNSTNVQLVPGGQPDNKWRIPASGAYKILLNISANPFINITPFTPYPNLWIVGDATPAGWNIDNPTPMSATIGNPFEFTFTGNLNAGEFKIPTTTGNWGTDYFMPPVNGAGASETNAIFIPAGNPDNKWKITEAGNYKVTVNQLYETITIQKL